MLSRLLHVLIQHVCRQMRSCGYLLTVLVVAGGASAQSYSPGQQQQQGGDTLFTCSEIEECVYWQECHEGLVNTGGIGVIDIRSPPPIPSNFTNPRPCQTFGKLCCVHPEKLANLGGQCPLHNLCVPKNQCYNGDIVTDGSGLLDLRVHGVPCTNPEYPLEEAVCCRRPPPYPLVTCPFAYQTCLYPHACDKTSGTYEAGGAACYVDAVAGVEGVCCSPPVLSQCSSGNVCVTQQQCTDQGFVNTDGTGNIDIRILDRCDLGGGEAGVCCLAPPVEQCSEANTVCSPPGICQETSLSRPGGYTETCYRSEGSGAVGECCRQPPATCSAEYTCNLPEHCTEPLETVVNNPQCVLKGAVIGVCCTKKPDPVDLVDVCPKGSVCLPDFLCEGIEQTTALPTYCRASQTGYSTPGVCCTNKPPVNPETPDAVCGEGAPDLDTRIYGDKLLKKTAAFAEFPWMGIVFFVNHTYKCGASLVADKWVLTAAHCVDGFYPADFRVRLGEYQVDSFDTQYPYEDYDVASITVHPGFNAKNLHNDVAVLELSTLVKWRHNINRICLPPADRVLAAGQVCIASGWGKDAFDGGKFQATLKKVILPVVPNDQCQVQLRKTRLGNFFILDKSFVCAGGEAGQDACTGDGGGPLMCQNPKNGRYELYGMTAWGIGCGIEGNPGVYVNVPFFMPWVSDIIGLTPTQHEQQVVGPYGK